MARELLILAVVLLVPAGAAAGPCTGCKVLVQTQAKFDRSGSSEVKGSDFKGPEPLVVSDAALELLNGNLGRAVDQVLGDLGVMHSRDSADLTRWKSQAGTLKTIGGDTFFVLTLDVGGHAPNGASFAGNQLRVSVRSLHRPEGLLGAARRAVPITPKLKWQMTALRTAVREVINAAFLDFQDQVRATLGRGERSLSVSVKVNGLEAKARDFVAGNLLPCIRNLFDASVDSAHLRDAAGYLEYAFVYRAPPGAPRELLSSNAALIRRSIGIGPKQECSLLGSPLSGQAVRVVEDELNRAVLVSFVRR